MSARRICVNDTDGDGNCAACARNPEAPRRRSARDAIDNLGDCYLTPGVHKRLIALLDVYRGEVLEEAADEAESVAESLRARQEFERSTGALDVTTELRRKAEEVRHH